MKKIILLFAICVMSISIFAQKNKLLTPNMEKAIEAYQNRDYKNTVELCNKEIETNPQNGLAYLYRASSSRNTQNTESDFEKAINLLKKYPKELCFAHLQKANFYYFVKEDIVTCENEIKKAIETKGNLELAYQKYSEFLKTNQRYKEAIVYLKKLIEINPNNYQAINVIINLTFDEDDIETAFEYANKSLQIYNKQANPHWYKAVYYISNNNLENCYQEIFAYANNLNEENNYDDYKYLEQLLRDLFLYNPELFRNKISEYQNQNPQKWAFACACAQYIKDYDVYSAYDICNKTCQDNPTIEDLHYCLSVCLNKMQDFPKALEQIQKCIDLSGQTTAENFYNMHIQKASILSNMKEYDKAIDLCDSIYIRIDAEMIKIFFGEYSQDKESYLTELLDYMAYIKDYESYICEYKRDYQKSLECSKDASDNFRYGRMLYMLGQKEEAKDTLTKVIQTLNPLQDYIKIAYCKIFMEDFDGAEQIIDNQISNERVATNDYYDIACMYSIMNKKEKAIKYLELALKFGFNQIFHIERDPDMDNIRDTKEYKEIIKEYKKE